MLLQSVVLSHGAPLNHPSRSALGNIPGVPKVHYKGRQGDFYIMVRAATCLLLLAAATE